MIIQTLLSILIGMIIVLVLTPKWIVKAKKLGLEGKDMNKFNPKEKVSEAGGICVVFGMVFGIIVYLLISFFAKVQLSAIPKILVFLITIILTSFIGLADDFHGWKKGLTKTARLIFLAIAALPLLVLNILYPNPYTLGLSFVYPIWFIILGFVGASSTFNFLAGYNGLETSQGIIVITALSIVNYLNKNIWLASIGIIIVACLIAFYHFNKFPAKVFPGNALTYTIGACIATIAILGRIELFAVFLFIPYIIETILKLRGNLNKESFGKAKSDGSLDKPYDKIYGLEHLAIVLLQKIKPSHKAYEKEVVLVINAFQIIMILLGILIFKVV